MCGFRLCGAPGGSQARRGGCLPPPGCCPAPAHLEAVKGKGVFVTAQLLIRLAARPAPANAHVPSSDSLELKVPPSRLHGVGFLSPEDPEPLPGAAAHFGSGSWEGKESL